jgi:predicted CoA-binding protein
MPSRAVIDEFLSHKQLALVRSSPSKPIPQGARIDLQLAAKGYSVAVVYLDESASGRRLADMKKPVEGVIVAVPRDQAEKAVREAIEANVPRVWLQSGCESEQAIAYCRQHDVPVIHGACVLMYAEPVASFHAFHRWLWKTFGLLAK